MLQSLTHAHAQAGRGRLVRAAAKLSRLFQLRSPDAPGLVFFGGQADPACLGAANAGAPIGSLAGSGLAPQPAFDACVGEGIEYLSQFAQPTDITQTATMAERCDELDDHGRGFVAACLAGCSDRPLDWMRLRRLTTGPDAWFPADLCLRRPVDARDFIAPVKLSTGCAAGPTAEDAVLRAVLELIERDAAALWWHGGRRGRAIVPHSEAGQSAAILLQQLRRGNAARETWLLDITTDLAIPAIAAVSVREDGFGFAFGLAARTSAPAAARAAIFEMCQSELAHHVVAAKRRDRGDTMLNYNDRRRLDHATRLDARQCALLQPLGNAGFAPANADEDATAALDFVLARLEALGIAAYFLDLTRPDFQVPVARVVAPQLQAEPSTIFGLRLRQAVQETGGGALHTAGLPLM